MRTNYESPEMVDASPSKRIYHSIIADYDLNRGICELIDNALDFWSQSGPSDDLSIQVTIDPAQQSIRIEDNAGGVPRTHVRSLVSPGDSRNKAEDATIGYFGVGSKRAAVALAMDISITTRTKGEDGFRIKYDEEWLGVEDDWDIPVFNIDGALEGSTTVELNRLRIQVDDDKIDRLRRHLGQTYGRFLTNKHLSLLVNGQSIAPVDYECWAYPPEYEPRRVHRSIQDEAGEVQVTIVGGLMKNSSPGEGDYGVYVYANDRLIARALKTHDVGFVSGQAGKPHPSASLMLVIVSFNGPARSMPWNSSKSDIHAQHPSFRQIQPLLISIAANWATLSRRLEGQWKTMVAPYTSGEIQDEGTSDPSKPSRSYLLKLPRKRPAPFASVVKKNNQALCKQKPWIAGIIDALIAVELILKERKIVQRNRIALILLDGTLEIALKDYLVNESGHVYSDKSLSEICRVRSEVQKEFIKYVPTIPEWDWSAIDYFYKIRCKLVHERASAGISDEQIQSHREVVHKILKEAFKLEL